MSDKWFSCVGWFYIPTSIPGAILWGVALDFLRHGVSRGGSTLSLRQRHTVWHLPFFCLHISAGRLGWVAYLWNRSPSRELMWWNRRPSLISAAGRIVARGSAVAYGEYRFNEGSPHLGLDSRFRDCRVSGRFDRGCGVESLDGRYRRPGLLMSRDRATRRSQQAGVRRSTALHLLC